MIARVAGPQSSVIWLLFITEQIIIVVKLLVHMITPNTPGDVRAGGVSLFVYVSTRVGHGARVSDALRCATWVRCTTTSTASSTSG